MSLRFQHWMCAAGAGLALLSAEAATATAVRDLVRVKGHERNVFTGMGIVVGLNGTGDSSKDSLVAARPYAELLRNLGNPVLSIDELAEADAYAIVSVTLTVPPTGAREGDRISVSVDSLFNASSLAGGRLVVSYLRPPLPDAPELVPYAFAEGPIVIEGENPRSGLIRAGAQMLQDIRTNPVTAGGTLELVMESQWADYPEAITVARVINDYFSLDGMPDIATVIDAKNILITVPEISRSNPAPFIAALLQIPVDPSLIQTEARIVINEKAGIILVTGNVEIGPVGITHKDLTITSITPPPQPDANNPRVDTSRWAPMDTTEGGTRSSARLKDLLAAFEQLKVPIADQIAIVNELEKTGALHAQIIRQ